MAAESGGNKLVAPPESGYAGHDVSLWSLEQLSEQAVDCARYGDHDDLLFLLKDTRIDGAVAWDNKTALHMAAANGHASIVDVLVERGADVDVPNAEGSTALHWACVNGQAQVARKLVDAGASVAVLNKSSRTPLDEAIAHNRIEVVEALQGSLGMGLAESDRVDPEQAGTEDANQGGDDDDDVPRKYG
ncbi:hypothetical protein RI054_09g46060 [Pseudoscourfieldia marina]